MESGGKKSEAESPEQANEDNAGVGRSYECMFCKRGFTTAQALGGHMNIHRKDRTRPRPVPVSLARKAEEFGSDGSYGYYPAQYMIRPPENNGVFVAGSTSRARRPQELSLFGDDVPLSLGLRFDGGDVEEGGEKKEEGEELDLELRLGHH